MGEISIKVLKYSIFSLFLWVLQPLAPVMAQQAMLGGGDAVLDSTSYERLVIIDNIFITGNRKTKDKIILRELSVEKGKSYPYEGLSEIPGLVCRKPTGAFYAIAKLPVDDAEKFASWLLTDFDVDGKTVMLAPVGDFYETRGLGQDEVRIAYVLNRESLQDAIRILKTALQTYPGSRMPAEQTA